MPTYEYACKSCDHRFEVQQSFADEPLRVCTECEGDLRKVFGSIAVTFKGSGFYKTDSRASSGSKSTSSSESSGDSSSTKSDTSTSETKSEPKKSDTSSAPAAAG